MQGIVTIQTGRIGKDSKIVMKFERTTLICKRGYSPEEAGVARAAQRLNVEVDAPRHVRHVRDKVSGEHLGADAMRSRHVNPSR